MIKGADVNIKMVKYANEKFYDEDKISFFQLNIETSQLPKDLIGKYDNIVSFYCLQWCRHCKQTAENMFALLRPGGRGLIVFLSYHYIFDIYLNQQQNKKYSSYLQVSEKYIRLIE